eukprot:scpid43466/ scgid30438/ 
MCRPDQRQDKMTATCKAFLHVRSMCDRCWTRPGIAAACDSYNARHPPHLPKPRAFLLTLVTGSPIRLVVTTLTTAAPVHLHQSDILTAIKKSSTIVASVSIN